MATTQQPGDSTENGGGSSVAPSSNVFTAPASKAEGASGKGTESHHSAPGAASGLDIGSLVDKLDFGIVVLNGRQEVIFENKTYRDMLGFGIRECGGIDAWFKALCPDPTHEKKVIASWQNHVWRNQLTRTFTLKGEDQKVREVEFRAQMGEDDGIVLTLQDVTQTSRTEEALRHAKMKFRALFTNTSTGSVLVDKTGRIIDANPAFTEFTGIQLTELRLSPFAELVHPRDAEGLEEQIEELRSRPRLRADDNFSRQIWLRTREKERKTNVTFCPVIGQDSEFSMGVYLFNGLISRGVSSAATRKLEALADRAKALLTSVPDLILLIGKDGKVIDYSPPAKAWPELAISESWKGAQLESIWPAFGELIDRTHSRIFDEGKIAHADLQSAGKRGGSFSVTLSPFGGDQAMAVVCNVTAKHRLEEAVAWYRALFVQTGDGVLLTDLKGWVMESNPAAEELLARKNLAVIGKRISSFYASSPKDGETFNEKLSSELNTKGSWSERCTIHRPDGNAELVDSLVVPVEHQGTPFALLNIIRALPQAAEGGGAEESQHQFRNQLQMITSLFALEPQNKESKEAFLKWQVRLRSLAQACPESSRVKIRIGSLIREVADEVASLARKGPGRKEVVVTAAEELTIAHELAAPFSLFVGEVIRMVICGPYDGPGPEMYVDVLKGQDDQIRMIIRPGIDRRLFSPDQEDEAETLDLLAQQIRGTLKAGMDERKVGTLQLLFRGKLD